MYDVRCIAVLQAMFQHSRAKHPARYEAVRATVLDSLDAKTDRTVASSATVRSAFALALRVPSRTQCFDTSDAPIAWPHDELGDEGDDEAEEDEEAKGPSSSGIESLPTQGLQALWNEMQVAARDLDRVEEQVKRDGVKVTTEGGKKVKVEVLQSYLHSEARVEFNAVFHLRLSFESLLQVSDRGLPTTSTATMSLIAVQRTGRACSASPRCSVRTY